MNVLLFSMPDSFEHMPSIVVRMPNGALSSLAGNVASHQRRPARAAGAAGTRTRMRTAGLVFEGDRCGLGVGRGRAAGGEAERYSSDRPTGPAAAGCTAG